MGFVSLNHSVLGTAVNDANPLICEALEQQGTKCIILAFNLYLGREAGVCKSTMSCGLFTMFIEGKPIFFVSFGQDVTNISVSLQFE